MYPETLFADDPSHATKVAMLLNLEVTQENFIKMTAELP
jgi:hypothetical protein